MSSISLNSNLASLGTQRRLGNTTVELGRSYERLSSGLRINRASDDAAGLAIASSLATDSRVFAQGIRNLNDGLSLLNVADGALSELSSIVIRIRELAEQSANGTLGKEQRQALDEEAQALSSEFTRIAQTTEINGIKLFDGGLDELGLQAGYGVRGAVSSTTGGAIGAGTFTAGFSVDVSSPSTIATGDFNADGILDLVTGDLNSPAILNVSLGQGDGSFQQATSYTLSGKAAVGISVGDFNGDGNLDLATVGYSEAVNILVGSGTGTFSEPMSFAVGLGSRDITAGDFNGDGVVDLVTTNYYDDSLSVLLGNGDATFSDAISIGTVLTEPFGISVGDFNADGILDLVSTSDGEEALLVFLGQGDGNFSSPTSFSTSSKDPRAVAVGDFNADGILDLASNQEDVIEVFIGEGDGSFFAAGTYAAAGAPGSLDAADLNGDGVLDLYSAGYVENAAFVYYGQGDGNFSEATTFATGVAPTALTAGDFNGDGVLDLASANSADANVSILLADTTSGVSALLPFSLATKADALQAMAPLDRKIEQLALQKGTIGAFQSRIDTAINNLQITRTNVQAAASRIADVDTASESAKLVRLNILQQAGAAILAQANQSPALALELLT